MFFNKVLYLKSKKKIILNSKTAVFYVFFFSFIFLKSVYFLLGSEIWKMNQFIILTQVILKVVMLSLYRLIRILSLSYVKSLFFHFWISSMKICMWVYLYNFLSHGCSMYTHPMLNWVKPQHTYQEHPLKSFAAWICTWWF